MSIKTSVRFIGFLILISWLVSCKTSKQLAYFQDLNDTTKIQTVAQYPYEPLKLMVDDQVQITISSTSPEAAQFFNLAASTTTSSGPGAVATPAQSMISVYTVSTNGNITMPVLGDVKVLDLTTEELKQKISQALTPYLKDAIVSVKLVNFKVTVIGEVAHPINLPINGERFTVLEAVGAAGDMTDFSNRFNVKVMRKSPEGLQVAHLNFNTSKILQSPFYQLHQNDIVYIEPNKDKGFKSEKIAIFLPFIVSITSFVVSVVSVILRYSR